MAPDDNNPTETTLAFTSMAGMTMRVGVDAAMVVLLVATPALSLPAPPGSVLPDCSLPLLAVPSQPGIVAGGTPMGVELIEVTVVTVGLELQSKTTKGPR